MEWSSPQMTLQSNYFAISLKETSKEKGVYRGRGAPCERSTTADSERTYTKIKFESAAGLHLCAPNYHCAELDGNPYFNNKVARFSRGPAYQNASSNVPESDLDLIGKGARYLVVPINIMEQKKFIYLKHVKFKK